jgi:hypothetical protein
LAQPLKFIAETEAAAREIAALKELLPVDATIKDLLELEAPAELVNSALQDFFSALDL